MKDFTQFPRRPCFLLYLKPLWLKKRYNLQDMLVPSSGLCWQKQTLDSNIILGSHLTMFNKIRFKTFELCRSITCPHLLVRASAENAATSWGEERAAMEDVIQIYKVPSSFSKSNLIQTYKREVQLSVILSRAFKPVSRGLNVLSVFLLVDL